MRSMHVVFAVAASAWLLIGCGGGGGGGDGGVISFSAGSFSMEEAGTALVPITLHREGGSGVVSVRVMLSDGTATGGMPPFTPPCDYDQTPIVVTWADGDFVDKTVDVFIIDGTTDEADESVHLSLANVTGGAGIGAASTATLMIMDDDVAGQIEFFSPTWFYNETGIPVGTVLIRRVGGVDGDVSATVVSTDGTANSDPLSPLEPVDYTPISKTIVFPDQDASPIMINIKANILQDALPEGDETVTLSLTNLTNGATLGAQGTSVLTIVDDDPFLVITENPPASGSRFGSSLAKVGSRLAIGASGAGASGRVSIFEPEAPSLSATLDGGLAQLFAPDSAEAGADAASRFGSHAVALADRWAVPDASSGSVLLLSAAGDLLATIPGPIAQPSARFGAALCEFDGVLVVGAPDFEVDGVPGAGAVFVIRVP
jgi:hypothetical protein